MVTRAIETFAVQAFACSDDDSTSECKFNNIYNRLYAIDQNVSMSSSSSNSKEIGMNDNNNNNNIRESKEETVKNVANEVNEI